jgi:iron complex outermembrane receptor protein
VHASALIITGGGAGVLRAEESDSKTIGFIWTPKIDWLPIRVAVDYFDIVVNDEIAQFGSANILRECYTDPVYLGSPFCSLFTRDLTPGPNYGKIVSVNNSYVNLNEQDIKGLDLTFQYKNEFDFGLVTFDFQGTFAFDQDLTFLVGNPNDYNGEIYSNDFVGNADLRLDRDNWTFVWSSKIFSRASNDEAIGDNVFGYRGLPECGTAAASNAFLQNVCIEAYYKQYAEFTMTHDLSVRYRTDEWTVQAGIINITDELAPTTSTGAGTTRIGEAVAVSNYDATGRRVFLNFGYQF